MTTGKKYSAIAGAAFLMATSAIGPGFITQTTVFTQQLLASFGFVILISILLDIAAQLNIWRIVAVAELPAQEISNKLMPGLGHLLSILIVLGGLAFNIGNIAGAGLGFNILFPLDQAIDRPVIGAIISAGIAILLFSLRDTGKALDWFARILGLVMIALTLYVAFRSNPPLKEAVRYSFLPVKMDVNAILTLVGGTVGGYISFAGAHRLLDAGIKGREQLPSVTKGSVQAILLASGMRVLLFLAALGVLVTGVSLDPGNPAASVFRIAAGEWGYKIFGIVLWSAAITSVVGSAYTSVSFLRSVHPWLNRQHRWVLYIFVLFSTLVFCWIGKPVKTLLIVGALNGLILPVALAIMLLATRKETIVGTYKHPAWMTIIGWLVVAIMSWMGIQGIR